MTELQLLVAGGGAVSRASTALRPLCLSLALLVAQPSCAQDFWLLHSRNPRASNPKNQADEEDEESKRRRLVGGFENCKVGVRML